MTGLALAFLRGHPICGLLTLFIDHSGVEAARLAVERDGPERGGPEPGRGNVGLTYHQQAKVP